MSGRQSPDSRGSGGAPGFGWDFHQASRDSTRLLRADFLR